jgi:S-(hydroxymethyl)glutathione dehydrogenase/alcohol dehydrogenase
MNAAVLETPGQPLRLRQVAIAAPAAGQVRVRVHHCGVCHSDLSIVDGTFPSPLPIILGHEAAGVVEAVGAGVHDLCVGDRVVLTPCPPCGTCYWCLRGEPTVCVNARAIQTNTFADGSTGLAVDGRLVYRGVGMAAFAEYVLTPASGAVKIAADVPLEVACVIGCAVQTGVGAVLNTAKVEEGASVLVMGLGGVGLSVVQGARLAGAARIIASDPVAERRERARHFGATDVIDPLQVDVTARARELTGPGVDYAFDAAGHASLIQTGLAATRDGGTTVCVGAPPLGEVLTIALPALFVVSEKKLLGCALGSSNSLREIPRLIALWQAGRLDLEGLITKRRPLGEINDALTDLADGRGIRTVLAL